VFKLGGIRDEIERRDGRPDEMGAAGASVGPLEVLPRATAVEAEEDQLVAELGYGNCGNLPGNWDGGLIGPPGECM
jgi:hypothetical protein